MRCLPDPHAVVRTVAQAAFLVTTVLAACGQGWADVESVGNLGEVDRLVVRGTLQIDPEQLRQPLVQDTDLVWLARPHASREAFISAVVRKARLTLERAGFAEATVQAAVESSAGVERLVLDVVEGLRFEAGAIEVTGLPDETVARLSEFLSTGQPSRTAVPSAVERTDVRPVQLDQPVWRPNGPAPCDAVTLHQIRVAVAQFLRDEGYLSIPLPLPERRTATRSTRSRPADGPGSRRGAFEVSLKTNDDTVRLLVAVNELPPKAVLQRIELPPACRTTQRELIAYLGMKLGEPVTDRDRLAWRERLRRSGRFLKHDVEFRSDPTDPAAAVARFSLEEYPPATPLSQPLSRAEATMLRFHDWLEEAIGRGDDLVVDVERPADGDAAGGPASASLIVAPSAGLLLTAFPGSDQACGLSVSGTSASLLPAGGTGRLEVPLPSHCRLTITVGLSLMRDASASKGQPHFKHTLSAACGLACGPLSGPPSGHGSCGPDGDRGPKSSGLAIGIAIEPVACLAFVHQGSPQVRFEENTLVVDVGGATSRFDATSGMPLGMSIADCSLSLVNRRAAIGSAVEPLRAASGPNRFRSDAPVASAVAFLLSAEVAVACRHIADAAGLHGDTRAAWEKQLERAVSMVRCCRDDGGLARGDALLTQSSAGVAAGIELEPLEIPVEDEPTSAAAAKKAVTRHVAAVVWRLTEEHCGRNSWPAALVRAAACGLVGDPAMLDEMAEFMGEDAYGPLAHVTASSLVTVPLVAASLARRGQERLSTVAFHTDCRPLFTALLPLGVDRCCVSLARSVDDNTAREIGRVACGDPDLLLPLVHSLRACDSYDTAVDGLQNSLDAWWDEALRKVVAARLHAVASPRTAAVPATQDEQPQKK
jgi:hypothetical protein